MDQKYNKFLEYLLSNEPDEVLSKKGIIIRKIINPVYRKLIPFSTKNKLKVERKSLPPKGVPIIYAATHGFRDDIVFTLKTIDKPTYLLYGSIPDFYYSLDGLALWLNGVIIIDRKDKKSRNASKKKMERAIELGADILMYPEGVWNKQQELIVQKLYPGIYDVAEKEKALVVPIATILEKNIGYSIQGEAYDITKFTLEDCIEIINRIKQNINKCIDLMIYDNDWQKEIKIKLNEINEYLYSMNYFDIAIDTLSDKEQENLADKMITTIDNISKMIKISIKTSNREQSLIEKSIEERVINLLKATADTKKNLAVEHLRDKMATEKWELISKYRQASREDFKEYNPIQKYWDEYLEELVKTANGLYDYEIENSAQFIDKNEINQDEVFEPMNNVELTLQNAPILTKVKRKN